MTYVTCVTKQKKETTNYRNIRLSLETYQQLDTYLLELVKTKANRRISLDNAVKSLLEEHYQGNGNN